MIVEVLVSSAVVLGGAAAVGSFVLRVLDRRRDRLDDDDSDQDRDRRGRDEGDAGPDGASDADPDRRGRQDLAS